MWKVIHEWGYDIISFTGKYVTIHDWCYIECLDLYFVICEIPGNCYCNPVYNSGIIWRIADTWFFMRPHLYTFLPTRNKWEFPSKNINWNWNSIVITYQITTLAPIWISYSYSNSGLHLSHMNVDNTVSHMFGNQHCAFVIIWCLLIAFVKHKFIIDGHLCSMYFCLYIYNTLRPRQDGRHFPDDIFKCIFLNENARILLKKSPKFVPNVGIHNIPALVQIMAWRRSRDKPLSEPMMVNLLTHICVTRPQWEPHTTLVISPYCQHTIVDAAKHPASHRIPPNVLLFMANMNTVVNVLLVYLSEYTDHSHRGNQCIAIEHCIYYNCTWRSMWYSVIPLHSMCICS